MAIKINTLLRNSMLSSVPSYGTLYIYTGSQPSSADSAPTGTLLVQINSISLKSPSKGSMSLYDTYQGTAVATGTAGWARYSVGSYNIDGSVGVSGSGADFIISTTSITTNDIVVLKSMTITMPEA